MLQQRIDMREEVLYEIFLELYKTYDTMDCGLCLNILAAYSVGPRALRLLWRYWDCFYTVARDGCYFGTPFKGKPTMKQGEPPSPMIFNVVVDAFLHQWV